MSNNDLNPNIYIDILKQRAGTLAAAVRYAPERVPAIVADYVLLVGRVGECLLKLPQDQRDRLRSEPGWLLGEVMADVLLTAQPGTLTTVTIGS